VTDTLIRMPRLADTLVEGTVARWLKNVGDTIAAGEPLASIETDKVTTDLTSPASGAVAELLVAEGATVAVDTAIARIGASAEAVAVAPAPSIAPTVVEPAAPEPTRRPTPIAARLLAEHGLDARDVGATRRVTRADVLRYLERKPESGPVALTSMRRAIAEHMVRAKQTIPHGQTVMLADLTDLVAWRDRRKSQFEREHGAPLTYTVCFVAALAHALAAPQQPVDVGVAVALDAGLVVPVIRGANELSLGETARALTDLASRARAGRLQPGETHGALMTVTNVGSFGNLFASPIVPLQQLGILGPGLVERRPLPTPDGLIKLGWRCWLTLMFDRRAFDDMAADRLLGAVVAELQHQ
jgi:pyruvate/2-oxoglutarate dehydrogenase complex dihydrolipoamide acyltransferase (E2) component